MTGYRPEFYEDENGTEPVLDRLRSLASYKRRAATAAIEHILGRQGAGVCRTGWGKWVKGVEGGIFELRVRAGYDKGETAASGIDQAEISRIERGQTNATAATLAALLAPLGARLGVVRNTDDHHVVAPGYAR